MTHGARVTRRTVTTETTMPDTITSFCWSTFVSPKNVIPYSSSNIEILFTTIDRGFSAPLIIIFDIFLSAAASVLFFFRCLAFLSLHRQRCLIFFRSLSVRCSLERWIPAPYGAATRRRATPHQNKPMPQTDDRVTLALARTAPRVHVLMSAHVPAHVVYAMSQQRVQI